MKCSEFYFNSHMDDKEIFTYRFECDENIEVKGVVQISHGMTEHGKRYEDFAKFLTDHGYNVYVNDHRGHGKTAKSLENAGYLANENGFDYLVEDMHRLSEIIKEENKDLPIILFGHSMGSFACQNYAIKYGDEIDALILCGSNGNFGPILGLADVVIRTATKIKGRKYRSEFINYLFFGNNNKNFKPIRTNFDWLCRDEKEVDKYINDPMCGFVSTCGFFEDFIQGLKFIEKRENIGKVRKDLSILIISGDKDPIGNDGKGILNLKSRYKKSGIEDVKYILYKDGRHEILNEINKEEVKQDIMKWIVEKIENKKLCPM